MWGVASDESKLTVKTETLAEQSVIVAKDELAGQVIFVYSMVPMESAGCAFLQYSAVVAEMPGVAWRLSLVFDQMFVEIEMRATFGSLEEKLPLAESLMTP